MPETTHPATARLALKEVPQSFRAKIIALSEAKNWEEARKEWKLLNVRHERDGVVCPCGRAVHWAHEAQNVLNGNRALLGTACARVTLAKADLDTLNRLHQLNGTHEKPDGETPDRPATVRIRRAYADRTHSALKAS